MLCCRCHKNIAVVFISKISPDGSQRNEGYCLSCAKELNLGPIDNILSKMGIDAEEMDRLNGEMKDVLDEMGDDFDIGDSAIRSACSAALWAALGRSRRARTAAGRERPSRKSSAKRTVCSTPTA